MIEVKSIKLDTEALDKYAASLGTNTDRALAAIAFQVLGIAKTKAPYDTGALSNSIEVEKAWGGYIVKDGVEYGVFQELGTSKMAAHPFMVPAVEQAARDVAKAVETELGK